MAPLDPFEEFWTKEEAEAAMEPPAPIPIPIPSSDVPPPPSPEVWPRLFSSDDSEGDEDDNEEDGEENMEVQIDDADATRQRMKEEEMARMQKILSTFTVAQMNRYEAFRRSGFSKVKINRLLNTIFGKDITKVAANNESKDINIVVSALAKLFTGDLIETARVVMTERKDTGPIRASHIRESYRRLKLEGKTFKPKTVPRLFY